MSMVGTDRFEAPMDVVSKSLQAIAGIVLTAGMAVMAPGVAAQTYPGKPISVVVSAGPGSSPDLVSRVLANALSERLGWTMVIENRPGGNFATGTRQVFRAPADGYTILASFSSMTVTPHSMPNLEYDMVKDFVPIGRAANSPTVMFASPAAPFKTVQELVAYAKAHPNELTYATAGYGSYHHLTGELFGQLNGIQMRNVPYKDANFGADVISGTVPVGINTLAVVVGLLDAGRLRGLAIVSKNRSAAAPSIPTLAEAGLPAMDLDVWIGWEVKTGTPQPIVDVLRREFATTLRSPATKAAFEKMGAAPAVNESPEDLRRLIQTQIETWGKVIREAKITFK